MYGAPIRAALERWAATHAARLADDAGARRDVVQVGLRLQAAGRALEASAHLGDAGQAARALDAAAGHVDVATWALRAWRWRRWWARRWRWLA